VQEVNVHLVEFRSWGGESGSPVFLYEEAILIPNSDLRPDLPAATIALADLRASDVQPRLLGMLHGHFDAHGRDENSGIAAVIPFEAIAEILRCNSLEVERNRILEERQRLAVRAPIPDCAH
jgi:hypothetical protein